MAAKRKTLVQQVCEQIINYGGIAATRVQVYEHAVTVYRTHYPKTKDGEREARRWAELRAFGSYAKEITADFAAQLIPYDFAVANGLIYGPND